MSQSEMKTPFPLDGISAAAPRCQTGKAAAQQSSSFEDCPEAWDGSSAVVSLVQQPPGHRTCASGGRMSDGQ